MKYRDQHNSSAGVGLYQVELALENGSDTHKDNWVHFLNYNSKKRRDWRDRILSTVRGWQLKIYSNATKLDYRYDPEYDFEKILPILEQELRNNDKYATLMAYLNYYRKTKNTFPDRNKVEAMAQTWKTYYNTKRGEGTTEEFIKKWKYVMGNYKFP